MKTSFNIENIKIDGRFSSVGSYGFDFDMSSPSIRLVFNNNVQTDIGMPSYSLNLNNSIQFAQNVDIGVPAFSLNINNSISQGIQYDLEVPNYSIRINNILIDSYGHVNLETPPLDNIVNVQHVSKDSVFDIAANNQIITHPESSLVWNTNTESIVPEFNTQQLTNSNGVVWNTNTESIVPEFSDNIVSVDGKQLDLQNISHAVITTGYERLVYFLHNRKLYVLGQSQRETTGSDSTIVAFYTPTIVPGTETLEFTSLENADGSRSIYLIDITGKLYYIGYNSYNYVEQSGIIPPLSENDYFLSVDGFWDASDYPSKGYRKLTYTGISNVKQVSCYDTNNKIGMIVLKNDNTVYYATRHSDNVVPSPTSSTGNKNFQFLNPIFYNNETPIRVFASLYKLGILTAEGNFWYCGQEQFNSLGGNNLTNGQWYNGLQKVAVNTKIVKAKWNYYSLMLLDENGDVWVKGYNREYCLAIPAKNSHITEITKVSMISDVKDLWHINTPSGSSFTVFEKNDGSFHFIGYNYYTFPLKNLGAATNYILDENSQIIPKPLTGELYGNRTIKKIKTITENKYYATYAQAVVLETDSDEIYIGGSSRYAYLYGMTGLFQYNQPLSRRFFDKTFKI